MKVLSHTALLVLLTLSSLYAVEQRASTQATFIPNIDKHIRVIFYPKNEAVILAEVDSKVRKIYVLPGQSFKKDQLLIELEDLVYRPAYSQARSMLELAEANNKRTTEILASRVRITHAETSLKAAAEKVQSLEELLEKDTRSKKAEAILAAAQQGYASVMKMRSSNEASVVEESNARRDVTVARSDLQMVLTNEKVELATAAKELTMAELELQDVTSSFDAEKKKVESDLARARVELALAVKNLNACSIIAPYAGRLSEMEVHDYEVVRKGEPLAKIIEDTTLYARFLLPSSMLKQVYKGQQVVINIPKLGCTATALLKRFSAEIDPASNTFEVTAEVDNTSGTLRAGISGWADIADFNSESK